MLNISRVLNNEDILRKTLAGRSKIVIEYRKKDMDKETIPAYVWIKEPNPSSPSEMLNYFLLRYNSIEKELNPLYEEYKTIFSN